MDPVEYMATSVNMHDGSVSTTHYASDRTSLDVKQESNEPKGKAPKQRIIAKKGY